MGVKTEISGNGHFNVHHVLTIPNLYNKHQLNRAHESYISAGKLCMLPETEVE